MAKKCIPGVICFENVTIVIIIVILLLVGFYIYKSNKRPSYNNNNIAIDTPMTMIPRPPFNNGGFVFNNSVLPPQRMANDTLLDPYQPPLRDNSGFNYFFGGMMPNMMPPPMIPNTLMPINIPTQGPPIVMRDDYQQVGILTRANGSEMILPLMGQSLYTNRDKWNYYTMSDNNNIVKLPISSRGKNCMSEYGCDSLNSGDHVRVEGYNDKFKVTIYDNKLMRYLPM